MANTIILGGGNASGSSIVVGSREDLNQLTEKEIENIEMFVCTDEDVPPANTYVTHEEISNPNLLINGDFKINPYSTTEYRTTTVDSEVCACWKLHDLDPAGALIWNADHTITLSAVTERTSVTQYIEDYQRLLNKPVTLSCEVDGQVLTFTSSNNGRQSKSEMFDIENGYIVLDVSCFGSSFSVNISVYAVSCTLSWIKLELSNVATPFIPTNTYEEYVKIYGTQHLSNPNLLINGDFRVNQRGQSSYTGTSGYTVDMWNINVSSTVTILDNGVNVSTSSQYGGIYQTIEDYEKFKGKTVTVSLEIANLTNDMRVAIVGGSTQGKSLVNGVNTFTVTLGTTNMTRLLVLIQKSATDGLTSSADILWIKLELGNVATPFSPRPYGEELALCNDYLLLGGMYGYAYSYNANTIYFMLPTPRSMRGTSTLIGTPNSTSAGGYFISTASGTQSGFTLTVVGVTKNGVIIGATKTGHGITNLSGVYIAFNGASGISCEL